MISVPNVTNITFCKSPFKFTFPVQAGSLVACFASHLSRKPKVFPMHNVCLKLSHPLQ